MAGLIICPNCAESIKADALMCRFCQRGISPRHFKKCRFCGEMVRYSARKCRFCASALPDAPPSSGRPPQGAPVPRPSTGPQREAAVALNQPEPEKEIEMPKARVLRLVDDP